MSILARVLRDRGIVGEKQIEQAIQHQVLFGGRLGTSLFELGLITEERLTEVLARVHGIRGPAVDVGAIEPESASLLPKEIAQRYRVFPYRAQGKTLFLLMVDPQDHAAIARVGFSLGYIVKPLVVPEFRMMQLLRDHYGIHDEQWRYEDHHRPAVIPPAPADPKAAAARLDQAASRDEVVEALLALCLARYRRALFFIVREPWVTGWHGGGEGASRDVARSLRVTLEEPSVFQAVTRDRSVFLGRLPATPANDAFRDAIGKRATTNAAVLPVVVRDRVVNLVYVDQGPGGNIRADLGDVLVAIQKVSQAYVRIIRRRIEETRRTTGAPAPAME